MKLTPAPAPRPPSGPPIDPTGRTHRLRLVPNLETSRSLAFEPVVRELFPIEVTPGLTPSAAAASISTLGPLINNRPPALLLKLGRYTDRSSQHGNTEDRPATGISGPTMTIAGGGGEVTNGKVAFKSKVVSRSHAEVWCDSTGKVCSQPNVGLMAVLYPRHGLFVGHLSQQHPPIFPQHRITPHTDQRRRCTPARRRLSGRAGGHV